jgi:sugar phosphate isomerase/epimerase
MRTKPKIYMGSWCFTFGFEHPASLETVVRVLSAFGFDGIAIGAGFTGHAPVEKYPDARSRKALVDMIQSHGLEIAGYTPDPYCMSWATGDENVLSAYDTYFSSCLKMGSDIGAPVMRVDTGSFGPLARGADYNSIWSRVVGTFRKQAKMAAKEGMTLVWEPETGQIFVKPSEIVKLVDDVGERNFKISYDFGHAQAISVLGHNQVQPLEKLANGQLDFIRMLRGKIGDVGFNDSDNNTYENLFGTHLGLGKGVLNFDVLLPAIVESGFEGPWWALDTIPMSPVVWTDAWNGIHSVRKLLEKYL